MMHESLSDDANREISQAEARQFIETINGLDDYFARQPKLVADLVPVELGGDKVLLDEDQMAFFDFDDKQVNVYKNNSASVEEQGIVEVKAWMVHVTTDLEIPGRPPTFIKQEFEIIQWDDDPLRPIYDETVKEIDPATGRVITVGEVADQMREAFSLEDRDAALERLDEINQRQQAKAREIQELEEMTGVFSTRFTKERLDEVMELLSRVSPEYQTIQEL